MRRSLPFSLLIATLALMGWGCTKPTPYIPAPEPEQVDVVPTAEGSRASTGGESATITPILSTERIVAALPPPTTAWQGDTVAELRNPIPLPDGTATEYTGATREYTHLATGKSIRVTITDTRGIPALTAFLDGYNERTTEDGYRSYIPVGERRGWMTYSYGPNREEDGSGSLILLERDRFTIQLDGSPGVSAEELARLAEQIDYTQFQ